MTRRRLLVTLLSALAAAAAGAQEYSIDADQVLVTYLAQVGAGQISGASRSLKWSVLALQGGAARVRLAVPIDSFDSGHGDLDSLLRGAVDSRHQQSVEVEGVVSDAHFEGTISMHGVSRPTSFDLELARHGTQIVAHASFAIGLRDFGLSLERVADRVSIDFFARLQANPLAVVASGAIGSVD
jgi:polyisoprenoid-binding protein YceI